MKIVKKVTIIVILFLMFHSIISACFVIRLSKDGNVLIGNNEDYRETKTKMWFIPKNDKEYGRVCFGFGDAYGFVQGGMNSEGLFMDALSIDNAETWKADPQKPYFEGQINDHILAKFSNIDEVKHFFETYNTYLGGKFVVADPSGRSIIIEYSDGKTRFLESNKYYQLAVNTIQFGIEGENNLNNRFRIAKKIVENENKASLKTVKKVLSALHKEWYNPTLYSYICDLKSKKVKVYNFHNFEEVYQFDLNKELKKGKHFYDIPSLFLVKTQAATSFKKMSPKKGVPEFIRILEKKGIDNAYKWYDTVKSKLISRPLFKFTENEFLTIGYKYLGEKKYKKAIAIFTLNCRAYPESANAWDSLAEAFMKNGENKMAAKYYKKSLRINPDNSNAKRILKILNKK